MKLPVEGVEGRKEERKEEAAMSSESMGGVVFWGYDIVQLRTVQWWLAC